MNGNSMMSQSLSSASVHSTNTTTTTTTTLSSSLPMLKNEYSPTRVTMTTTTIEIGQNGRHMIVLPPMAIATTTTTTTTTAFPATLDSLDIVTPFEEELEQDEPSSFPWWTTCFTRYRNAILHILCMMVQTLATIANVAITVFGLGVGVGLILGDSLRGNGATSEESTTTATPTVPTTYSLARPATPSCRALLRRNELQTNGGTNRASNATSSSSDTMPAQ